MSIDPNVDLALGAELLALEPMELGLRPETVFMFVGMLQLVLRHPGLPPQVRATAERFLAGARVYFAECPTVLAMIRLGDDPGFDTKIDLGRWSS